MSERFDKFMFEGMRGLKSDLEAEGVKEISSEARKIKNGFADNSLFDFLSVNDISDKVVNAKDEANDSTLLLRSPEGKVTLQNYAMSLGGARAQEKFRNKLIARYRNFKNLSSVQQIGMLNYVYRETKTSEMGSREEGKLSDSNILDEELLAVLSKFKYTKNNLSVGGEAISKPIKNFSKEVMFDGSKMPRNEKEDMYSLLLGQPFEIKSKLKPFIDRLKNELGDLSEQPISVEKISAGSLLGKYDLKLLKRREAIYDYWEEIGTTKWAEFRKTHVEFVAAMKKLISGSKNNDFIKEVQSLIDIEVDTLQYVMQYEAKNLPADSPLVNSVKLFELFVEENKDNENLIYQEGGYRTSNEKGGGQVGELDYDSVEDGDIEEKLSNILEDLDEGLENAADPLLHYAYELGAVGLKGKPVLLSEIKKIKLMLRNTLVVIDAEGLEDTLNELLDNIESMAIDSSRKTFYLPYQKELYGEIPYGPMNDSSNLFNASNVEQTKKYLRLLSEFIDVGNDFDRGATGGSSNKYKFPAREGGRGGSRMKDFSELKMEEKFTKYLSAVMEYFVIPARSRFRPLKSSLPHIVPRDINILGKETPASQNAFIHLLRMEFSTDEGIILNKTQLTQINRLLDTLTRPAVSNRLREFIGEVRSFAIMISNVYDNTVTNEVNIEMGAFLHDVLEKNGIAPQKFGIGNEKMTNEWNAEYEENKSRVLPFEGIYDHIRYRESSYRAANLATEIKTLIRLESKLDITKSQEESTILQAHDEIRKMLGKPIYYGLGKVDSYDNVADTLDLMKSMFSVDLTAMELENIVNDFDSMQNLSTKHGISKEGIYFLKANFR